MPTLVPASPSWPERCFAATAPTVALSGSDALTTYGFNTQTAKHLFCSTCGIKSFYVPRSHPDGFSVNARCVDPGTIEEMTVTQINGREWEKQFPEGRGAFS